MDRTSSETSPTEARPDQTQIEKEILDLTPNVRQYLSNLIKNSPLRNDLDDLVQEAMIKATSKSASFSREKGSALFWVLRIARNNLFDHYRRQSHRQTTELDANAGATLKRNLTSPDPSPERNAIKQEQQSLLFQEIAKLPQKQAEAMNMFFNGYEYREIASKMLIPEGTVKSLLFRAKQTLMESLKEK